MARRTEMTDREKMIDLIINAKRTDPETGSFAEYLADFLLGYGVKLPTSHPGKPLTLEQLREMDGQPAWCEDVGRWAIVSVSDAGKWKGVPFALFVRDGARFEWDIEDRGLCMHPYPPAHIDRSEWISVKERLPSIRDDGIAECYLISDGNLIHMAYYVTGEWRFCESGQITEPMFYEVTHWMPLPEPPEEG